MLLRYIGGGGGVCVRAHVRVRVCDATILNGYA